MTYLSGSGIVIRFVFAVALVLCTYNPSGYSYYHWIKDIFPNLTSITPYIAISGIALIIGWIIYLRATLRSIGVVGIGLVLAISACIIWLLFDWKVLNVDDKRPIAWLVLCLVALALTVGMCWSHIRRRMSGQVDSDDVGDD